MSLPSSWIDRIFEKLTLVYGRDFTSKYDNISIVDVKTEWCDLLGGFYDHPEAIAFALENLPDTRAPNVLEFRALCRQSPRHSLALLPAPKADKLMVDEQLRKMAESAFKTPVDERGKVDHKRWAKKLRDRHAKGDALNLFQVMAYRKALDVQDYA